MALIKLTILIKKQDHLSDEEFHNYWLHEHPKIVLGTKIGKEKIVKYSQMHVNRPLTDSLRPTAEQIRSTIPPFDGYAELYFRNVDDMLAAVADEEYQTVVVADEQKFTKKEEWQVMLGWTEDVYDEGKLLVEGMKVEGLLSSASK